MPAVGSEYVMQKASLCCKRRIYTIDSDVCIEGGYICHRRRISVMGSDMYRCQKGQYGILGPIGPISTYGVLRAENLYQLRQIWSSMEYVANGGIRMSFSNSWTNMDAWLFAGMAYREPGIHYVEHGCGCQTGLYMSVSA